MCMRLCALAFLCVVCALAVCCSCVPMLLCVIAVLYLVLSCLPFVCMIYVLAIVDVLVL